MIKFLIFWIIIPIHSYVWIEKNASADIVELREDVKKGVYVENLSIKTVTSAEDAYSVLTKGLLNRHTGATEVNRESSRSHSVFTMFIQSTVGTIII